MISLSYDSTTGALCGSIAIDIVSQLKDHDFETIQPSSFRFHMATTLGGAILILATLLIRPLSTIGLQQEQPIYAEIFQEGVKMLRDLSTRLQTARHIIDNLEDIIQVVTSILDHSQSPESHEGSVNHIPANMDTMFLYGATDFAQQAALLDDLLGNCIGSTGGDTSNHDGMHSLDSWDYDLLPTTNGNSVAWI
jgi:hypothetical protein